MADLRVIFSKLTELKSLTYTVFEFCTFLTKLSIPFYNNIAMIISNRSRANDIIKVFKSSDSCSITMHRANFIVLDIVIYDSPCNEENRIVEDDRTIEDGKARSVSDDEDIEFCDANEIMIAGSEYRQANISVYISNSKEQEMICKYRTIRFI